MADPNEISTDMARTMGVTPGTTGSTTSTTGTTTATNGVDGLREFINKVMRLVSNPAEFMKQWLTEQQKVVAAKQMTFEDTVDLLIDELKTKIAAGDYGMMGEQGMVEAMASAWKLKSSVSGDQNAEEYAKILETSDGSVIGVTAKGKVNTLYQSPTASSGMTQYQRESLDTQRDQNRITEQNNVLNRTYDFTKLRRDAWNNAANRMVPEGTTVSPINESSKYLRSVFGGDQKDIPLATREYQDPTMDVMWAKAMMMLNGNNQGASPMSASTSPVATTGADYSKSNLAAGNSQLGLESSLAPAGEISDQQYAWLKEQLPYAIWASQQTGIPASTLLAMRANDSGWASNPITPFGIKDPNGIPLDTIEGAERTASVEKFAPSTSIKSGWEKIIGEMNSPKYQAAPRDDLGEFLDFLQGGNPEGTLWAYDAPKGSRQSTGQYKGQITTLQKQIEQMMEKRGMDNYIGAMRSAPSGSLPANAALPYEPTDITINRAQPVATRPTSTQAVTPPQSAPLLGMTAARQSLASSGLMPTQANIFNEPKRIWEMISAQGLSPQPQSASPAVPIVGAGNIDLRTIWDMLRRRNMNFVP